MSSSRPDFSKIAFTKALVLPALLVFLIPVISLVFFLYAQSDFDADWREAVLKQIRQDKKMTEAERAEAIQFFETVPFSQMLENPEFAATVDKDVRFHYATFRWMIRLSAISIVSSIAVVLLAGICVLCSLRSRFAQYLSLSISWHVLRIFGALQAVIQGVLLVALSFWVTALLFEFYSVKLIIVAGFLAIGGVCVVIAGIFKKPNTDFEIEGEVITRDESQPLWSELQAICDKVGTQPVDQIIAGIDDNFFVTEMPVTVGSKTYHGRTLFISLSLLRELQASEADAVLAHEMAHFSGQDTMYSKKISPLLNRYGHYLQALHEGGSTLPFFYFILCFVRLFDLSLNRLSRNREFRADRIAAEATSPRDLAGALLRIAAYSKYRGTVEQDLFEQEQALETVDVADRIEQGFRSYATAFLADPEVAEMQTAHPFDSHPPLHQRLEAVDIVFDSDESRSLLETEADGGWFQLIPGAEQLEQQQWHEYQERFRHFHEHTLPYRFLPETDEEKEIVRKAFPQVSFEGKDGTLEIDYEKVAFDPWHDPIYYREISNCQLNDNNVLQISYERTGIQKESIKISRFAKPTQEEVLDAFNHYYTRYLAAVDYQQQKQKQSESTSV